MNSRYKPVVVLTIVVGLIGVVVYSNLSKAASQDKNASTATATNQMVTNDTNHVNSIGDANTTNTQIPEMAVKGYMAPDFTLTDIHGKTVTLSSLRGKPVYLNFFASWCPPCQMETPDLVKMHEKYGSKVAFYSIDLMQEDNLPDLQKFLSTYGVTYDTLVDSKSMVAALYNVQGTPTSVFIDKHGIVQNIVTGGLSQQSMTSMFQQLAGE